MPPEQFPQRFHTEDGNGAEDRHTPFLSVQRRHTQQAAADQCQQELDGKDTAHDLDKSHILPDVVQQVQLLCPDVPP